MHDAVRAEPAGGVSALVPILAEGVVVGLTAWCVVSLVVFLVLERRESR